MPPLPPVANVVKVNQKWKLDNNSTAESIWHFEYSGGPPSAATCAALAADIQAAFIGQFETAIATINGVGPTTMLDIGSDTGAEGTGGTTTAGTRSGVPMPASTAVVFNHAIARRYRGGKPRSYVPLGVQGDISSTGTWATGFLSTQSASWVTFIENALAATSGGVSLTAFGCVSYTLNKVPRTTPVFETITGTVPRVRIGTQRRRNKTA